jgi:hypothetical protein
MIQRAIKTNNNRSSINFIKNNLQIIVIHFNGVNFSSNKLNLDRLFTDITSDKKTIYRMKKKVPTFDEFLKNNYISADEISKKIGYTYRIYDISEDLISKFEFCKCLSEELRKRGHIILSKQVMEAHTSLIA